MENFFSRLKDFGALATRYEKSVRNFLAGVYPAAAIIWLD
jgi:transposase